MSLILSRMDQKFADLRVSTKLFMLMVVPLVAIAVISGASIWALHEAKDVLGNTAEVGRRQAAVERVNGLVYAVVAESRGIYMATTPRRSASSRTASKSIWLPSRRRCRNCREARCPTSRQRRWRRFTRSSNSLIFAGRWWPLVALKDRLPPGSLATTTRTARPARRSTRHWSS